MKFYLAPLEGITGYTFRNAYAKYFGGMDKYYAPFLVAHSKRDFHKRELNDILPENNSNIELVPQILTNQAEDFLLAAKKMQELGYTEVNLNLGCPSKTVVSKHRGAGFLENVKELERFFDRVFQEVSVDVSVKTRLGMEFTSEFEDLLGVYNQFPIKELIVHPRLQCDYYKGQPRMEQYAYAAANSKLPLCYNGDIFTVADYQNLMNTYPDTQAVMLGRGVLRNLGLIREITSGQKLNKEELRLYHDEICKGYEAIMSGDVPVLFKMKELWFYMSHLFESPDKYMKKLKKAQHLRDYYAVIDEMFLQLPLANEEE